MISLFLLKFTLHFWAVARLNIPRAQRYRLKGKTIPNQSQNSPTAIRVSADPTQLSAQPAHVESVFHNVPSAVILTDQDGRIHNMNEAAQTLLGKPDKDLLLGDWPRAFGLYLQDGTTLFPAQNLPPMRVLEGIKDVPAVRMLLRSRVDNQEHKVLMSAGAIAARDGRIDGITVLIQEVSQQREAEAAESRHAEGLHRFSDLLAQSIADVNRIANAVAAVTSEIIGDLSAVTLIEPGGSRLNLIACHDADPAIASRFRELLDAANAEGMGSVEAAIMSPDAGMAGSSQGGAGSRPPSIFNRFIEEADIAAVLAAPLLGREGPLGAITLFRHHGGQPYSAADRSFLSDIAGRAALAIENCLLFDSLQSEIFARLSAAQALDLSEERFQSIFESTSLGIKVLDLNGTILQTNAAFQRIIGYSEAEVLGHRFYDFLHPADMTRAVSVFQKLKKEGVPSLRFQHRAIHKNGSTVWVNATFSAVRKGGGDRSLAFIVSILEDVTDQKKFEGEMAELKNRLQSTMELERLRLAHELHDGPMQDLYSIAYELEELRSRTDRATSEALGNVSENIHRVLNGLRETAKELRPPTISQFGLEKTIRSYVADLLEKHPELTIHLSLARDHQLLPEDVRLALFRVFQQSLNNIIRHAQATEVRIQFSFDAEEARLEVSDNGKGFKVPANWIEFVRHGHFGLAGAAERINALGGIFVVESQPPNSTTVRAVVPWKEHLQ